MAASTTNTTGPTDVVAVLADVAVVLDLAGNVEDIDFPKEDQSVIERCCNEVYYHDLGSEDFHFAIASKAGSKDKRNKNVSGIEW